MGRMKTPATREAQKQRAREKAKRECDWFWARGQMPPLALYCEAGGKRQHYTRDAVHMDTGRRLCALFAAMAGLDKLDTNGKAAA